MGLDISCDCDNISFRAGSYSGFSNFRRCLAVAVGINLGEMQGFTADHEAKQWTGEEPFYELLYHSDCDGELSVEECTKLKEDFDKLSDTIPIRTLCTDEYNNEKYDDWRAAVNHAVADSCTLHFH